MSQQILPDAIERYLAGLNRGSEPVLDAIAAEGRRRELPIVHPETGRLLRMLVAATSARRVLEIGTSIGYSAAWMARALPPGGLLITFERDHDLANEARANFARAGVSDMANVMVGDAARLVWKVAGPFDLIFQDGDKLLYEPLLDRLLALLRPGGLLVADNALWHGEVVPGYVAQPHDPADATAAIAAYNQRLATDPRVVSLVLPLGDGVSLAVKWPGGKRVADDEVQPRDVAAWLYDAIADAERRGLPELKPLLENLAQFTTLLRAADWNDDAGGVAQK